MSEDQPRSTMSFMGHLQELRKRLMRMAFAVVLAAVVLFVYTEPLIDLIYLRMTKPDFITYQWLCWVSETLDLDRTLCAGKIELTLQSIEVTGQFNTNVYFAFIGGIVAVFPYLFYQLWQFVKPALKEKEKKAAVGVIFWSSMLFFLGIAFGYFMITPMCVQFFGNYKLAPGISNNFTITSYISIVTTTTFFTGLFFELPVVVSILSRLGLLTPEFLKKYRKHAYIVILIIAAIITPPDVASQIIVTIPVIVLYEISIGISARVIAKRDKQRI
jgi:sec-independent protein translocase protein TatC